MKKAVLEHRRRGSWTRVVPPPFKVCEVLLILVLIITLYGNDNGGAIWAHQTIKQTLLHHKQPSVQKAKIADSNKVTIVNSI